MFRKQLRSFTWGGWMLMTLAPVAPAIAQTPPIEETKTACDKPSVSVLLIDDQINTPGWMADQIRRFQLPSPAQVLRKALQFSNCFLILDSDPVFWTMPGTAQPDVIFRASVTELTAQEKNLGEKASTAVGRYLGSYLGANDAEVPLLQSVAVQIDVLCPKTRRSATRVGARRTVEGRNERADSQQNSAAMVEAFGEAAHGLESKARQGMSLCGVAAKEAP